MTSSTSAPVLQSQGWIQAELRGAAGVLTLNRPQALNALSLEMIRDLTACLLDWQQDPRVLAVVLRGQRREGKVPVFCAGGDIRFFHAAALAGDPRLGDFFTEEYRLNHLIHGYAKPVVALMDGLTFGGGMGISQGATLRVVTEHSRLAMPETRIGLFPDVGGGWFMSRCPGRSGEWLSLTGQALAADDAIAMGLADIQVPSTQLPSLLDALTQAADAAGMLGAVRARSVEPSASFLAAGREQLDRHFGHPSLQEVVASLGADTDPTAQAALAALEGRSPLMMAVTLEQLRRARGMTLAQVLRMERDVVHHCFHLRPGTASETVEGIRALAVDKDHAPRWNPSHISDVTPDLVAPFFDSPWPAHAHPLRALV